MKSTFSHEPSNFEPIILNNDNSWLIENETEITVMGWGSSETGNAVSRVLQEVAMTIKSVVTDTENDIHQPGEAGCGNYYTKSECCGAAKLCSWMPNRCPNDNYEAGECPVSLA